MFTFLKKTKPEQSFLNAQRIYLRRPHETDFESWKGLREKSEAELRPFEPTWQEDEIALSGFKRRLKIYKIHQMRKTGDSFFIFHKNTHALLGAITLSNIRYGEVQTASLGYWLGTEYTGHGYMRETLLLLSLYSFQTLGLNRLEAACIKENQRSQKVLQNMGFTAEGILRSYFRINGEWRDHILYSRLKNDI